MIVLLEYINLYLCMTYKFNLTPDKDSQSYCNSLPTMLALCLMLSGTYYHYYAKNYVGLHGPNCTVRVLV